MLPADELALDEPAPLAEDGTALRPELAAHLEKPPSVVKFWTWRRRRWRT